MLQSPDNRIKLTPIRQYWPGTQTMLTLNTGTSQSMISVPALSVMYLFNVTIRDYFTTSSACNLAIRDVGGTVLFYISARNSLVGAYATDIIDYSVPIEIYAGQDIYCSLSAGNSMIVSIRYIMEGTGYR